MMYKEFFVFVSEKHFGVFRVDASDYPQIFKTNLAFTKLVEYSSINNYLLDRVGKNCLIKNRYKLPFDIGRLVER